MKCGNLYTAVFATASLLMSHSASAQNNGAHPAANDAAQTVTTTHYQPLPRIREDDMLRKRRVWEEINVKSQNSPTSVFYAYNNKMPLLDVLIKGVIEDTIVAYSTENDRFTHALTKDEFKAAYGKTTAKNTPIIKYLIKEDSLYVNTGEITTRIIGIAPVAAVTAADGTVTEKTLFWIFYPDVRAYLASVPVSGDDGWYDIFEHKAYAATITNLSDAK